MTAHNAPDGTPLEARHIADCVAVEQCPSVSIGGLHCFLEKGHEGMHRGEAFNMIGAWGFRCDGSDL